MFYPKWLFHNVNAACYPAKTSQGKDYFHHSDWDLSNNELDEITWESEECN